MSKALELLANIDKKYNSELQRTEEQLLSGIEQTSQIIKDNLSTRANITATAIQQSDEISAEPTEQLTADRKAARPVPSLATVQIEPFKANERADTDRRTASSEQKAY